MLSSITFTGADHTVARHRLLTLCQTRRFPIEIAFLVSEPRMGSARYPTMAVATSLAEMVKSSGQKTAVHLCGGAARLLFARGWRAGFIPGLVELLRNIDRIQINVAQDQVTTENILRAQQVLHDLLGEKTLIFQWRQLEFPTPPPGVRWLYDVSGGRGEAPKSWPALPDGQTIGLAGGLGPGLVAPLLTEIGFTETEFWLDMESSLRDQDDRFNVDACFQVLEEAHEANQDLWREENQKWACGSCGNFPPCPCTQEQEADALG